MNYILISGWAAFWIIATVVLLVFGFCGAVAAFNDELRKNKRLNSRNEFLRNRLSVTQQELYRVNCRLPEYEERRGRQMLPAGKESGYVQMYDYR